jgi:hypothetical protein
MKRKDENRRAYTLIKEGVKGRERLERLERLAEEPKFRRMGKE